MEKEMEKVKTAFEDFGKKVVDAVKKGKGEADKVTRIAQIRIEIGSLGRQQRELYQELGELFYKNLDRPSKKGEQEVAEAVTHIREIEKSVGSLKRTLKALREDKPVPKKRGRPAKAATGEKAAAGKKGRPSKAASAGSAAAPKRRGRPPKNTSTQKPGTAAKRRGRPPKSAGTDKT